MVFEHLVFFFVGVIIVFIPDVPTAVKLQVSQVLLPYSASALSDAKRKAPHQRGKILQ